MGFSACLHGLLILYLNNTCPYFGIFTRLAVFLYNHKVAPTAHAPRGQALLSAVALEDLLDSWELQPSALGLPALGLALGFFSSIILTRRPFKTT